MHKRKFNFWKELSKKIKRLFRARNIIIVSDHKLDHVPLSGTMQVLILVGVLGFFSGVSYLTGSYMNARVVIREKEKTIARTKQEKANINEEMAMLKRDIANFSSNNKEIAADAKFLSKHFETQSFNTLPEAQNNVSPLFNQGADKLSIKVAYLEDRMKQMQADNDRLIRAIRLRTAKKIDLFEDIIAMTGLDSDSLEQQASAKMKQKTEALNAPAKPATKTVAHSNENQGGPFIDFDSSKLSRADNDLLANVDKLVLLHDILQQLPLNYPVENAQTTSGFGRRIDPFNGRVAIHPGLDFAAAYGTPIAVTSAGKVVFAGRKAAYGNAVDVEHGFGIVTRYAHLSKIIAKEGDRVKKGQIIGLEGSTGRSTGAHLHYEVRIDDHPVNPQKFLEAGEYVSEK